MVVTKQIFSKAGSGYTVLIKESNSVYAHFYSLDSQQKVIGLTTTEGIDKYLKELRKQGILTPFPITSQYFEGAIHHLGYHLVSIISDGVITKILG